MKSRLSPAAYAVFLIFSVLAGCSAAPSRLATEQCHGNACQAPEFLIGAGDVLHISVWKDKTLDQQVTVRPDGMISFPLVNDVQAAGLTPLQLKASLTKSLKKYMSTPEVSVVVVTIHSYAVYVLGGVIHPGRYELTGRATVLDALALAGGLDKFASRSKIVIIRNRGAVKESIPFDYADAVSKSGEGKVFYLRAGDLVMVP